MIVRIPGEIEENSDCDKPFPVEELPLNKEVLDGSGIYSADGPGHIAHEPAVAIKPHPQQHIRNKGLVEAPIAPAALRVTQGVIHIPD